MFYIFYLKKILISNPNLLKNKKKFIKESTAPIYVVNKIQASLLSLERTKKAGEGEGGGSRGCHHFSGDSLRGRWH